MATLLLLLGAVALLGAGGHAICPGGACRQVALDAAGLALLQSWRSAPADAFFATVT